VPARVDFECDGERQRRPPSGWTWRVVGSTVLATSAWFGMIGCGDVQSTTGTIASGSDGVSQIVASEVEPVVAGPDAPPKVRLARRFRDGTLSPLRGDYIDATEFRAGMAAVTTQRELQLVHHDGTKSVLARQVDGLPARGEDDTLVYTTRYGEIVEICRLTALGSIRRLASFRGSATQLAPQRDGTVIFVGAVVGGVSGVWIADASGARCLTNCDLRAGQPWGDGYRAPPGDAATVRVTGVRVEWQTPAGQLESALLEARR
jgi:hypothetical protein